MTEEPDLTVAEVAAMLEATPATVRRWIHQGRLPQARKASGRAGWRVPRADVERLRAPEAGDALVARGLETPKHPAG